MRGIAATSEDGRRRVFPGNRASGTHLSEALLRNLVVCLWHLANMLNALTNVRLWVQSDIYQPLLTNLDL